MKLTPKTQSDTTLKKVAITNPVFLDAYRELAHQGQLMNVSSWVRPEMGFNESSGRARALITAELWRLLVSISPWAKRWQTTHSRGRDVLWMASYALQQARKVGRQSYTFQAFLPTDDDEEALFMLRVEYAATESGRTMVLIGLAEQTALA